MITWWADLHLVFQKYDPNFLAGSLDEAYLDITNFCHDKGMTGGEVCLVMTCAWIETLIFCIAFHIVVITLTTTTTIIINFPLMFDNNAF